jgi:hypothetical protein
MHQVIILFTRIGGGSVIARLKGAHILRMALEAGIFDIQITTMLQGIGVIGWRCAFGINITKYFRE